MSQHFGIFVLIPSLLAGLTVFLIALAIINGSHRRWDEQHRASGDPLPGSGDHPRRAGGSVVGDVPTGVGILHMDGRSLEGDDLQLAGGGC